MKLGYLMEYNMRNIFLKKQTQNMVKSKNGNGKIYNPSILKHSVKFY